MTTRRTSESMTARTEGMVGRTSTASARRWLDARARDDERHRTSESLRADYRLPRLSR